MVAFVEQDVDHAVGFGLIRRQFVGRMVVKLHLSMTDDHNVDTRGAAVTADDAQCQYYNKK